MAREWSDYVTGQFETPFGVMDFALTSGDHVSISAGGSSNKAGRIVVNGVPYYAHFHFFRQRDGGWATKNRTDLYMTRETGADATAAAMRKAAEGVNAAWRLFIDEQPMLLSEAEASHLNREIGEVEEKIGEKQAELDTLLAARDGLLRREADLQG